VLARVDGVEVGPVVRVERHPPQPVDHLSAIGKLALDPRKHVAPTTVSVSLTRAVDLSRDTHSVNHECRIGKYQRVGVGNDLAFGTSPTRSAVLTDQPPRERL